MVFESCERSPAAPERNFAHLMLRKPAAAWVLLLGSFLFLYRDVLVGLVRDWAIDDNYSHGFLILPIALFLAWERRRRFLAAVRRPSNFGFILVLLSLAGLLAGTLGAELFTARISLLGIIAGGLLFLYGWYYLRILFFPLALLLLMVPIPAIIFNQIAFPLQLLASRFGELVLTMFQIPVLREGNLIHLSNTTLEVAEACSGIRSLVSLLTLGIVYGYFADSRIWIRTVLALATVPIAVAANGCRVAGTGVVAHYYGPQAAEGFFHSFSGWLIFLIAFILLFALHRLLVRIFKRPAGV